VEPDDFSETITLTTLLGIALSIASMIVLTLSAKPEDVSQSPLLGNTLEFLAMICATRRQLC
jgi:hypothetical protein